ncbi:MAG: hypothetical protein J6Y68_02975 [Clostridia bacterium]|nr:hypothetical protein [Clostridia bacterium]
MATKKKSSKKSISSKKTTSSSKSTSKTVSSVVKKLHPITKVVVAIFAVLGIVVGVIVGFVLSKNDRFVLKGNSLYSYDVSSSDYIYKEEGIEVVCFGFDISDKLTVETNLSKNASGDYIIPGTVEGTYYIKYSVDFFKFGEDAPNGPIIRVRTFTVSSSEDDGRAEENANA